MTINRNNYEEFFLLYVDNELSAPGKNAVENFLIENPDLQEEMLMLQQSILIPDSAVFADKENLFKQEVIDSDIQQQLILMLDNELDKTTKEKLVSLTKKDETIRKEWELLQQTKLPAEEKIIFEHKAILYKQEGGRVIAARWWKIAAAAVVIGFGVWSVLNYSNSPGSIQPGIETVNKNSGKPSATPVVPGIENEQPVVEDKNSSVDVATTINQTKQDEQVKPVLPIKTKNTVGADNKQKAAAPKQSNDVAKQREVKTNNLPTPLENINNRSSNNNEVAIVTPSDNNSKIDNNNTSQGNDVTQPAEEIPANSFAVQTINHIDSDSESEEDNKNRKSKIGGFFKKIKRVVERKTNTKSGDNSIRIANMSFAMQ
jgi:hypothetical protein